MDKPCEHCSLPLTKYKGESNLSFSKKRFHKPCKDKWMKENGIGFHSGLFYKKRLD